MPRRYEDEDDDEQDCQRCSQGSTLFPRWSKTSYVGFVIMLIGAILSVLNLSRDTTVGDGSDRVHNIGLLTKMLANMIFSVGMTIVGAIFYVSRDPANEPLIDGDEWALRNRVGIYIAGFLAAMVAIGIVVYSVAIKK